MSRHGVPDFTWEFNQKTEKYKQNSEYENFSIHIDSPYQWGAGWTEIESKNFYGEILPKLRNAGFKNIQEGKLGVSPSIIGRKPMDLTDVYLHPMEFSGYATKQDIEKITKVLDSCDKKNVISYRISYQKTVNAMNNHEYKELMIQNTANIARWMEEMESRGYRPWEMGEMFARYCRIARVGDNVGLSSLDTDWEFVENLYHIKEKLKEMQKEQEETMDDDRDR